MQNYTLGIFTKIIIKLYFIAISIIRFFWLKFILPFWRGTHALTNVTNLRIFFTLSKHFWEVCIQMRLQSIVKKRGIHLADSFLKSNSSERIWYSFLWDACSLSNFRHFQLTIFQNNIIRFMYSHLNYSLSEPIH